MTLRQEIKQLKAANERLRWENLRMRLEIEIFLDGFESRAAKKILARYRHKREIRDEASKATQN